MNEIIRQMQATLQECRRLNLPVEVTLRYASVVAQAYDDEDDDDDDISGL